jgi:hypothetical protein
MIGKLSLICQKKFKYLSGNIRSVPVSLIEIAKTVERQSNDKPQEISGNDVRWKAFVRTRRVSSTLGRQ